MPNIFDHLNNITYTKGPYLGDEGWNIYMINRYLSMKRDYCELINAVQKNFRAYSYVPNEVMYEAYKNIIPKEKVWLKYVKNQKKEKYKPEELEAVATVYEISTTEAQDFIDLMSKDEIKRLMEVTGNSKVKKTKVK